MKYIVELNPAMHIHYCEVEADTDEEAVAKATASDGKDDVGNGFSHWELINVYPSEEVQS